MTKVRVEKKIGNSVLSFETGYLAKQAHAAVVAQYGETVTINTATGGPGRPGHLVGDSPSGASMRRLHTLDQRIHTPASVPHAAMPMPVSPTIHRLEPR